MVKNYLLSFQFSLDVIKWNIYGTFGYNNDNWRCYNMATLTNDNVNFICGLA
jgi:hypothetical protein